jgi:hypothetical protein
MHYADLLTRGENRKRPGTSPGRLVRRSYDVTDLRMKIQNVVQKIDSVNLPFKHFTADSPG